MGTINTAKVNDRRELNFKSLDDIAGEIERLAQARKLKTVGNWTPGQILRHLAIVMNGAVDGLEIPLPFFMRIIVPIMVFFRKSAFLNGRMPSGIQLPKAATETLVPPPTTWEEGLATIRSAIQRFQAAPVLKPHPFMGELSRDEWTKLQCRHCELHLSFLDVDS